MNSGLELLHQWAKDRATMDPDESARPLWAQIGREVGAYLDRDTPAPTDDDDTAQLPGL